jgi:hypothetical protein
LEWPLRFAKPLGPGLKISQRRLRRREFLVQPRCLRLLVVGESSGFIGIIGETDASQPSGIQMHRIRVTHAMLFPFCYSLGVSLLASRSAFYDGVVALLIRTCCAVTSVCVCVCVCVFYLSFRCCFKQKCICLHFCLFITLCVLHSSGDKVYAEALPTRRLTF